MTQLPTHISHYEIRRVLGQGGMGIVYLAVDPALQRQVALKVLRANSDDQRERFRREARIVARLQHPNIVAIYTVGEHEQQPFIAMEYIDGEPLSDGIRRRAPWSLQRKLQMAVDLCAGLAFAHRAGVVHRDVKPSNLIVTNETGTVRLLDFGIARGVDAAATMGLTMLGNIVGTLNYMSPEQITGQPLDHRSDIFAVGLVLYELLAYRQAFPGDNLATLTYHIVHGAAEPLRNLQPDLDPELCAVVERAMARSPEQRYPHLEAMRTDLLRSMSRLSPETADQVMTSSVAAPTPPSGQPLIWSHALDATESADGATSTGSTARVPDAAPALEAPPEDRASVTRWPRAAGAAAVAVAGAAGLALWLTLGPDVPPVAPSVATTPESNTGRVSTPDSGTSTDRPGDVPSDATRSNEPAETRPTEEAVPPVPDPAAVPPAGNRGTGTQGTASPTARPPLTKAGATKEGSKTEPARPETPSQGQTSATPPPVTPSGGTTPEPQKDADPTPTTPVVTPPPPVIAPAGPSDEELVQATLTRWARAYAARDARAVDEVQPGTEREFAEQFGQLRSVELSLSGCRIAVQQTRATADCAESYSAELKVGGGRAGGTRRRHFALDKSSGGWRITSARISR